MPAHWPASLFLMVLADAASLKTEFSPHRFFLLRREGILFITHLSVRYPTCLDFLAAQAKRRTLVKELLCALS
jgi:hypothetical protein